MLLGICSVCKYNKYNGVFIYLSNLTKFKLKVVKLFYSDKFGH